jgi:hypothetical protein
MTCRDEVVAPSLQYLVAVLKLSKFFAIGSGCSHAIRHLPKHPEFTPVLQLQLARQFDIMAWVDPAFRELVARPLKTITAVDAEQIGLIAYHTLVQTQGELREHALSIAFNPPPVIIGWACPNENACEKAWDWAWWGGFARHLLHPDNTRPFREIMLELDSNRARISQMCEDCLRNTVEYDGSFVQKLFSARAESSARALKPNSIN